ncbi:hypothetical protein MNBD_PLANCTO03-76 [hydrothermal vent metagenome]|uniref:CheW-like domain-containing protein n=1 Tax=hydrothermal vent metagenome TaxID=652676 RepID=A0A3B1E1D8_9ZZZZ
MTSSSATRQPDSDVKLLGIERAGAHYMVRLRDILRITPAGGMEPDPLSPEFVVGVLPGEDRVPVVDLAERMDAEGKAQVEGFVVVIAFGDLEVGFLIDRATGLVEHASSEVQEEAWLSGMHSRPEGVRGYIRQGDACSEVLALEALLDDEERTAILAFGHAERGAYALGSVEQRRARAETERERREHPQREHAGSYVVVRAGEMLIGLPSRDIMEIVPTDGLRRIPKTEEALAGVLLLRDQTFAVADLRARLGLAAVDEPGRAVVILVRDGEATTGIRVDSVVGRRRIDVGELREVDQSSLVVHAEFVRAMAELDIGSVLLVDIGAVLADQRQALLVSSREFRAGLEQE